MNKVFLCIFYTVLVVVLLFAGAVAYFFFQIHRSMSNLNAIPLSPANYQPAALELVKLCQCDPTLFSEQSVSYLDPFDPVWAPPSVAKLHPEMIDVSADHANVTWGGGFYHCGWELLRGSATADGSGYSWTLSFYSEGNPNKVLETINVGADHRLTEDDFVRQVLAEFDRRLASQADDGMYTFESEWYLAAARCLFLAKHHRTDLLPAQVRKAATNYPHDWRDVLLGYLPDQVAGDPSAAEKLRRWADRTTGPAAWMYAAYAFYQAGEITAGDAAIKKAVAATSPDPDWIDKDAPLYELGMAARLYDSGNFSACVSLCDGILSSRHRYFTTNSSVQRLRDWAAATAASRPVQLPTFDKYTSLDPFGGFDLNLMNAAATSSRPSTTQP
jgi:hypothetical protein